MDPYALVSRPCHLCGQTTSMWCGRCRNVWYCTTQHLETDWPRHRQECVPVGLDQPQHGPTPGRQQYVTLSGLLFPPNEERPRIVQISSRLPQSSSATCPIPLVNQFFTEGQPYAVILTQGLNGEPLRFPLHIFYCPQSLIRGSPVNNAVRRITGGARTVKSWCGPVVVLKFAGSRRQSYAEASANDFPALSAYFLAYR